MFTAISILHILNLGVASLRVGSKNGWNEVEFFLCDVMQHEPQGVPSLNQKQKGDE